MVSRNTLKPVNEVLVGVQNVASLRFLTYHMSFADDLQCDILSDSNLQTFRTLAYDMAGNQVYRMTELDTLIRLDTWSPCSQEEADDTMADEIMNGIRIRTNDGKPITIPHFSTLEELRMKSSIMGVLQVGNQA